MNIQVVGMSFRIKENPEIAKLTPKGEVSLVPEPDNPVDKEAIKVIWEGYHVGYIPSKLDNRYDLPSSAKIEEVFYADTEFAERAQWCDRGDFIGMTISVDTKIERYMFGEDIVEYNDAEHSYTLNGDRLISPSKVAGLFSDGKNINRLIKWAYDNYDTYGEFEAGFAQAGDDGTAVHEICERAFKEKTGHPVDNFMGKISPKLISKEEVCFIKELGVAGRYDALVDISGKKVLLDWKNGSFKPKYYVQLALYAKAIEADEAWCVSFKTNNKCGYTIKKMDQETIEKWYKVATKLVEIYNLIK